MFVLFIVKLSIQKLKPGFPRADVNKVEIEELVEFKYIPSWDEMLKHLNENWDDPTTINVTNPTIVAVATSASTEASQSTITYATIAAGQIIMVDLPTTDIGWIEVIIDFYEPIS